MNEGPTGFAMDVAYWILPRFLNTTPDPVVLDASKPGPCSCA